MNFPSACEYIIGQHGGAPLSYSQRESESGEMFQPLKVISNTKILQSLHCSDKKVPIPVIFIHSNLIFHYVHCENDQ